MAQGKNNKTRFSNKSNLKNAAVTVATIVGPGKFVKAAQIAKKAAKTAKAAKAAKAAAKTTKDLPKGPTVKNPPKPSGTNNSLKSSGSKAIEDMFKRDAKIKAQKAADFAEDRRRLAQMARDKVANKPIKNKSQFVSDMAPYNWTGK